MSRLPRRRLLGALALAAPLAGCSGPSGGPDGSDGPDGGAGGYGGSDGSGDADGPGSSGGASPTAAGAHTATPTDTPAPRTTDDGDLDLREANVVGVAFTRDGGSVGFDVTLLHDDDGEDGYANWWQVETLDGDRLGRRELLHAHSTAPFTRSETVEVPGDVTCVVVRGHDRIHGYGGQAALADLDTGEVKPVRQGPEPRSFTGGDCP